MANRKTQTRKKKTSHTENGSDPLSNVELFDPQTAVSADTEPSDEISTPLSPLGIPTPMPMPMQASLHNQLQDSQSQLKKLETKIEAQNDELRVLERKNFELEMALKQANATIEDLKKERDIRLGLEREIAALEVQVQQVHHAAATLEEERQDRIQIERKLATLEILAERSQEMAAQLAEERNARVTLERERATLEVQVDNMKKLEVLLNEERQARMNAQSRASTAEARLARIEGELNQGGSNNSGGSGILGRLRGN